MSVYGTPITEPQPPTGMHPNTAEDNLLGAPMAWRAESRLDRSTHWPSAQGSGAVNNLYNLPWQPWQPCGRHCASCWQQFPPPYSFHSGGEDRKYTSKERNKIISDNGECYEETKIASDDRELWRGLLFYMSQKKRGLTEEGMFELRSK